ncbi:MAG: hypothetical protein WAW37_09650 [Syntrophobacteraceae bacterium]
MRTTILAVVLFFALAGFCMSAEEPTIPGTYVSKQDSKEYLALYPDGTFILKQRKKPPEIENPFVEIPGKYRIVGEDITLTLTDGGEAIGKIKDNKFEDAGGAIWVKQGSEKATGPIRPTKRLKTF